MEKETINLKKLYELIDEYKQVAIDGESVEVIATPAEDDKKRELTIRLEGNVMNSQKVFTFNSADSFDKVILPSIVSYLYAGKPFDGWESFDEPNSVASIKAYTETDDGVSLFVESNNPEVFSIIETSSNIITQRTQYSKVDKDDKYYMWNAILRYVNGRMFQIDSKGLDFPDEDRDKLFEFIKLVSKDDFSKKKYVYTGSVETTRANIASLLENQEKLSELGYDPEFIDKIKQNVSIVALTKLIINERKFDNYLDKCENKDEVLERVEFAKYQLNGMKANYFKSSNREETVVKLREEYATSDAYSDEQKSLYIGYCDELLKYIKTVKGDLNRVQESPVNLEEEIDAEERAYDYYNDYELFDKIAHEMKELAIGNEKVAIQNIESNEKGKKLVRITLLNSPSKRDSYVFAFDESNYDQQLIDVVAEEVVEKEAEERIVEPETQNDSKEGNDGAKPPKEEIVGSLEEKTGDPNLRETAQEPPVEPKEGNDGAEPPKEDGVESLEENIGDPNLRETAQEPPVEPKEGNDGAEPPKEEGVGSLEEKTGDLNPVGPKDMTASATTQEERYQIFEKTVIANMLTQDADIRVLDFDNTGVYRIEIKTDEVDYVYSFDANNFDGERVRGVLGTWHSNKCGILDDRILPPKIAREMWIPKEPSSLSFQYKRLIYEKNGDVHASVTKGISKDKYYLVLNNSESYKVIAYDISNFDGRQVRETLGDKLADECGILDDRIIPKETLDAMERASSSYLMFDSNYHSELTNNPNGVQVSLVEGVDKSKYFIEVKSPSKTELYKFDVSTFDGKRVREILGDELSDKLGVTDTAIVAKNDETKEPPVVEPPVVEPLEENPSDNDTELDVIVNDYYQFFEHCLGNSYVELLDGRDEWYYLKVTNKIENKLDEQLFAFRKATFDGISIRESIGNDLADELGITDTEILPEKIMELGNHPALSNFDYMKEIYEEYRLAMVNGKLVVESRENGRVATVPDMIMNDIKFAQVWGIVVGFGSDLDEYPYRIVFEKFDELLSADTKNYDSQLLKKIEGVFITFFGEEGAKKYNDLFGNEALNMMVFDYYNHLARDDKYAKESISQAYTKYRVMNRSLAIESNDTSTFDMQDYKWTRLKVGVCRDAALANQHLFDNYYELLKIFRDHEAIDADITLTASDYFRARNRRDFVIKRLDVNYNIDFYTLKHLPLSPIYQEILEKPPETLEGNDAAKEFIKYLRLIGDKDISEFSKDDVDYINSMTINNPYARLDEFVRLSVDSGFLGFKTSNIVGSIIRDDIRGGEKALVDDVLEYLFLVEKSSREGLTIEEAENVNAHELRMPEIAQAVTEDYEDKKRIQFTKLRIKSYDDKTEYAKEFNKLYKKYRLDENGKIINRRTGKEYEPKTKKEKAEISFGVTWFDNVNHTVTNANNDLIKLFINYVKYSNDEKFDMEAFRRVSKYFGYAGTLGTMACEKIYGVVEQVRANVQDMLEFSEVEKRYGKKKIRNNYLEDLAGLNGIDSTKFLGDEEKKLVGIIDRQFPERYKSSSAYEKFGKNMTETLSDVFGIVKSQLLNDKQPTAKSIYKEFPVASKERKYAKKLLATPENLQTVCNVVDHNYGIGFTKEKAAAEKETREAIGAMIVK